MTLHPESTNSVYIATRNYPDKQFRVINFLQDRRKVYLPTSNVFLTVERLFDIKEKDIIIVVLGRSTQIPNLHLSINGCISRFDFDRVFIFLEEVNTLYHSKKKYIVSSEDHVVPKIDFISSREYDLVKKITESIDKDRLHIYHCEHGIDMMAQNHGIDKIKYFDWCVTDHIDMIYTAYQNDDFNLPDLSDLDFTHKVSCFNYRYSDERYYISSILSCYDNVDLSQFYRIESEEFSKNRIIPTQFEKGIQQDIISGNKILLNKCIDSPARSKYDARKIIPVLSDQSTRELIYRINNSFVHLITETRFSTPFANFSEKTLRCLYARRPFILIATPGTLELLKNLGVKTFNDYWDESYDLIKDPVLRFEKVVSVVRDLLLKDKDQLRSMLRSMQPIIEHNYAIFDRLPELMRDYSQSQ